MPEGDTIWRAAKSLRAMLEGKVIRAATASAPGVDAGALVGHVLVEVSAHGKNLLMRFDDDQVLHTHMRMTGSWHIYPPTERWRKPAHRARIVLEVDDAVAVCFNAPVVELRRSKGVPAAVATLGPDILAPKFDLSEVLRRMHQGPDRPLGEALLDQQLVAGIGNIYKSETLFACRVNPFACLDEVGDSALAALLERARGFMRANLSTLRRTFRIVGEADRIWVYKRRGEPCFRCGTPIDMRRQGSALRSTYFCSTCQGVGAQPTTPTS